MSEFTKDYRWTSPNADPTADAKVVGLMGLRDRTADLLDALDARVRSLEARVGSATETAADPLTVSTVPAEPAPEFDPALVHRLADEGRGLTLHVVAVLRLLRAEGRLCEPGEVDALRKRLAESEARYAKAEDDRDYWNKIAMKWQKKAGGALEALRD